MSSATVVKLNIGGAHFQTTTSTLTRFDGFFKTLLDTDVPITKDESGAIFIDRNPAHFGKILDYMRDGKVVLPNAPEEVEEIRNEAQFYLLSGLTELCSSVEISSGAPKKSVFAQSDEELVEMITNSTKKVLVLCYYDPSKYNILSKTTNAMMLYGKKVDFCLREKNFSKFHVCEKQTNRVTEGEAYDDLNWTITNLIPNIDQY